MAEHAARIRHAVERGEFREAASLWEEWSAILAQSMSQHVLDPAEWERAKELYHWSRTVIICERTHLLHRLNTLHAAGAYAAANPVRNSNLIRSSF
jgi:hypothetical protein